MNYSTMKRKGSKAHQSNSERYKSKTQRSYTAPATPPARRDLHTVSTAWLALDSSARFTKRETVVSLVLFPTTSSDAIPKPQPLREDKQKKALTEWWSRRPDKRKEEISRIKRRSDRNELKIGWDVIPCANACFCSMSSSFPNWGLG
jgi:hypothetical protein